MVEVVPAQHLLKRKRKGGTWNAFVQTQCAATAGRPDMRAVAEKYKKVKTDNGAEFQNLARLAKANTAVSKKPRRFRGYASIALSKTGLLQSFFKKSAGPQSSFYERGVAIVKQTEGTGTALAWASALQKLEAERVLKEEKEAMATLAEYESSLGKQQLEKMCSVYRFLNPQDFRALPLGPLVVLKHEPPVAETAVHATHVAFHDYRQSNLGASLSKFWEAWHTTVPDELAGGVGASSCESLCFKEGRCVCTGKGKLMLKFRKCLNSYLSSTARKKQNWKSLLRGGSLALKLQPGSLDVTSQEIGAPKICSVATAAASSTDMVADDGSLLLHIAMMYLSPVRATFQLLHRVPSMCTAAQNLAMPRTYTQELLSKLLVQKQSLPNISAQIFGIEQLDNWS
eukprot:6239545-Amphidinium_carterae.2